MVKIGLKSAGLFGFYVCLFVFLVKVNFASFRSSRLKTTNPSCREFLSKINFDPLLSVHILQNLVNRETYFPEKFLREYGNRDLFLC